MTTEGVRRIRRADGAVVADVHVPPSKSIANRALVCAALAEGASTIVGIAPGDDTNAMVTGLRTLGCAVAVDRDGDVSTARVEGCNGDLAPGPADLDAALAGTTSRFLTALAALGPGPYRIVGDEPLRRRPMGPLHDALRALGVSLESEGEWGHLPVTVAGPPRGADAVVMPGNVSSQYVTALMLVAPYLPGGLRLGLSTELVSAPYVAITEAVMEAFGATDVEVSPRRVHVGAGGYVGRTYHVEADASSASYPLAAAAMVGGAICVRGLGAASLQGDRVFVDLLAEMGCSTIVSDGDTVVMRRRDSPLRGIDVDMSAISDLVPTLAVVATQAVSATRIRGVGFIRGKESDRLGDLAAELAKTGADVEVEDDGLLIRPTDLLHGARIDPHHDHRLAMALGLLGLVVSGIEIESPGVVSKSWPEYWQTLDEIPAHRG